MSKKSHKKILGPWILTALVTGNMIGSGIFLLPSTLAAYGSISLFGWLVTACGALLLALVFAQLSIWKPMTGGPYAYCHQAYGEFAGFQIAYYYWIALWIGNAAIIVACVGYLSFFWPVLATNNALRLIVNLVILWIFTGINLIGVKEAGIVQVITTILKLLPLLAIIAFGLPSLNLHHLNEFNISGHSNWVALQSTAALTLWAFIGVESATIPAETTINPERNIPLATIAGTLLTSIVYIGSSIVIMSLIPMQLLAQSNSPFADAAIKLFGNWGSSLIAVGAIISCLGTLNGWVLLQAQIPMVAARNHLFPSIFTKQNKREAPTYGLLISSILISILLTLNAQEKLVKEFELIILMAVLASVIAYFYTAIAQIKLQHEFTKQKKKSLWRHTTIAILAAIYSFWAIAGAGEKIVYYGMLLFFSSVPIYVWMKYSKLTK